MNTYKKPDVALPTVPIGSIFIRGVIKALTRSDESAISPCAK